jgi:probable F420-dependent oxidoreductase
VRFSFTLPVLRDVAARDPYARMFELARIGEEAGFDTATIGHHHFMPGNLSDPLTVLAAVAARTDTLRIGTGIFQLPFHHPVQVAEQVATVDEISGGRVALAVGLGWWPLEYEVFGADFRRRGALMEEALEILRHVWTRPGEGYEGRFHRFDPLTVYPRPVQQPYPPIWVAGVADAAIDRAARLGDAWLCGPTQPSERVVDCLATYRAACERLGRTSPWILRRYAWVDTDVRRVRDDVLPAYVDGLVGHWRESAEDDIERELIRRIDAGEDVSPTEVADTRLLWGTPDEVIAQIEQYRDLTGCDDIHAAFGAGLPTRSADHGHYGSFETIAEMIRLFGREVIPAFPG